MPDDFNFGPELTNPDNEKTEIKSPPQAYSFGSMMDRSGVISIDKVESLRGRPIEDVEGNPITPHPGGVLLEQQISALATMTPGQGGRQSILAYKSGDTVYVKSYKEEAIVRRVGVDGRIRVKFANGDKCWVKLANIVKL
jgi:hypothetical protein